MKRASNFQPHSVTREDRPDGTILLSAQQPLGPVEKTTGDWLHHWSDASPDHVFIAERSGLGWREEAYRSVLEQVRAIAESLLARGFNKETPILIMSGNGIDHALLALAAQYVGVPTVPVAEQYSLIRGAQARLQHAIELVKPAMAYVIDAGQYAEALALDALGGIEIVASNFEDSKHKAAITPFANLLKGDASADIDSAHANVTPDTVAKILMTSGSTSAPKGVLTTHRMLCTNQAQIADALPFLRSGAPRILDWLPWNHVFGGSHNFNMMLANGGSLYIDDGKPVKGLFERTLENLSLVTGTLAFNVPVGFSMLLGALQGNTQLRRQFFEELDLIFYAGASLTQDVWEALETMAMEVKGEIPLMTSSWGLTETAPATLMQQEPTRRSGVVGVPMTGVVAKLIPNEEMRYEVRVKGPNVMPGYFKAPEQSAAAFDDEGFFITGDAMQFVDTNDPNKGMRFEGRISEDFKLVTGTWVHASQLRLDLLARLAPLANDVVITGADREQIGLMIFPSQSALDGETVNTAEHNGVLTHDRLFSELHRRLTEHAASCTGSSTRVARAIVLSEPASIAEGEITAKGNLNFRRVLTRRNALLNRLYNDNDPGVITL